VLDGSTSALQLQSAQLGREYKGSASRWNLQIYFYCGIIVIANHLDLVSLRICLPPPCITQLGESCYSFFSFENHPAKYTRMNNDNLLLYFSYKSDCYMHAIYITQTSPSTKGLLYIIALLTDVVYGV
jgi:hypothetical protein